MSFKSLIIFTLIGSVGYVTAAPLAGRHLGTRDSCQGIGCAHYFLGNEYSNLSRRLAEFEGNNVTLSSASSVGSTTVNPSATSVNPSLPTPDDDPYSTSSVGSPSIPSVTPSSISSSISGGIPQAGANGPVTITLTSTVFVNPTNPAASLPTQSSSSIPVISSGTVPGVSVSSSPGLIPPSGIFVPPPTPSVSQTIFELSQGIPSSSISSNSAGQPTPSPAIPGIIFSPPA